MYGLLIFMTVVFLGAFIAGMVKHFSWFDSAITALVVAFLGGVTVGIIFYYLVTPQMERGWREVERVYLDTTGNKVNTCFVERENENNYVFNPAIGHEIILTPIEDTDVYGHSDESPFLVRYQCVIKKFDKWLPCEKTKRWQVYLPPGTLVAGKRI